ncbi:hypothetical protein SETIT_1G038600v2 [Setaria italica]|uniref:Uncharacterized protein n=1 Tax=Setaria italica TaxID=4555 RepID=K3Z1P5_SETIT|nr:hypothetical protein SETIT_1G038600v2 [Setaria italica]
MSLRLGAIRSLALVFFVMAVLMAISSVAAIRGGSGGICETPNPPSRQPGGGGCGPPP